MPPPSNLSLVDCLPYYLATPTQRERALTHTRQLLEPQLSGFANEQWAAMFDKYAPQLCLELATGAVALANDTLVEFANWVNIHRDADEEVPLYGHEAYYLARNLVSYSLDAKELLTADPELSRPESISLMRAFLNRLSVGNSVAEHIYHTFQKPIGQIR